MLVAQFFLFLLILSAATYVLAKRRVLGFARLNQGQGKRKLTTKENRIGLQALPSFYGTRALYFTFIPVVLLWTLWLIFSPILEQQLLNEVSTSLITPSSSAADLLVLQRQLMDARDIEQLGGFDFNLLDQAQVAQAVHSLKIFARFDQQVVYLLLFALGAILGLFAVFSSRPSLRARHGVEKWNAALMLGCSLIAILITLGIISSLVVQAVKFFALYSPFDFLTGLRWSPHTIEKGGTFGIVPLILGTSLVSLIAMLVAVPVGLLSAIYLSEFASPRARDMLKPVLEILAGIPTVVYGLFGALFFAPLLKSFLELPPFETLLTFVYGLFGMPEQSIPIDFALAAGMVMGVMITPFVASMSDDALKSVPQALRDGAFGLGSTRSEVIRKVLLPAALPGISGGILLAVSRAIGETMIMVMMLGTFAYLNVNPLKPVSTFTVQINALLLGDNDYMSAPVLSAFAIGLFLFLITLLLNTIALYIVRRYRETYD